MNKDFSLSSIIKDPAKLLDLNKTELVTLDVMLDNQITELTAMKSEARKILLPLVDLNGEVIGDQQVVKGTKIIVKTTVEEAEQVGAVLEQIDPEKIPLEAARELGATLKVVDQIMIRKMVKKGAIIPGIEKIEYLMIKPVVASKDVEVAG